jgi:hypothetical protein
MVCLTPFTLRSFCQDQLVQSQIRNGFTQALILVLQTLQLLQLVGAHSAVLVWRENRPLDAFLFALTPTIECLFSHTNLPDRIQTWHTLPRQSLNLPQLHDNLLRLWPLVGKVLPPFS